MDRSHQSQDAEDYPPSQTRGMQRSDYAASNDITVFNLQPQPPRNSDASHVYGPLPCRGTPSDGQTSDRVTRLPCNIDGRLITEQGFRGESVRTDHEVDAEWGSPYDLNQNCPVTREFAANEDLNISSSGAYTSGGQDGIHCPQNHTRLNQALHTENQVIFKKAHYGTYQRIFSYKFPTSQRPALETNHERNTMYIPSKGLYCQNLSLPMDEQAMQTSCSSPNIHSQSRTFSSESFRSQENMQRVPTVLQIEDSEGRQPHKTSQNYKAKSVIQYFVPLNTGDGNVIPYFKPAKSQDSRSEAVLMRLTTPVSIHANLQSNPGFKAHVSMLSQRYVQCSSDQTHSSHPESKTSSGAKKCDTSSEQSRNPQHFCSDKLSQPKPHEVPISKEEQLQLNRIGPHLSDSATGQDGACAPQIRTDTPQKIVDKSETAAQNLETGCLVSGQSPIHFNSDSSADQLPRKSDMDCDTDSDVICLEAQYNQQAFEGKSKFEKDCPVNFRQTDCHSIRDADETGQRDGLPSFNEVNCSDKEVIVVKESNIISRSTDKECTIVKKSDNCTPLDLRKKIVSTTQSFSSDDPTFEMQDTVESPSDSVSELRILETVSLAGLVPSGQLNTLQQMSEEGFYRCCCQKGRCNFTSQHQAHFESHLQDVHRVESEFPCVHCGDQENSPGRLMYHLDQHLDFQRYSLYCTQPVCDFHSFSPDSVVNHMAVRHPDLSIHTCWCCSQVFGSLQQFTYHVKQNLLQVAVCPHCDAKDTEGWRILSHITKEHTGQARMIMYHRLLLCRERKVSGWTLSETLEASTNGTVDDGCRTETDCERRVLQDKDTDGRENFQDSQISPNKTTVEKDISSGDLRPTRPIPKNTCLESTKPEDVTETASEKTITYSGIENVSDTVTSSPKITGLKLLLRRNEKGLEVVDNKNVDSRTDNVDSQMRLEMEPVDYEFTADVSVEDDVEMSDQGDAHRASTDSDSTVSSLGCMSPPTLTSDQRKNYICTVTSEGKSIRLTSKKRKRSDFYKAKKTVNAFSQGIALRNKSEKTTTGDGVPEKSGPTAKNTGKIYTCLLCSHVSRLSPSIYQHMYSKHKEILDCPLCQKRCPTRTIFFNHLTAKHRKEAKAIYRQTKITKWIQVSLKNSDRAHGKGSIKTVRTDSSLSYQNYPVKDYFLLCGLGKNKSFHCVLCDFSFKKYHRSSSHIYRSMYKHLFLEHIPRAFQCPHCPFNDCNEEQIRTHMEKSHADLEQEPKLLLLPISPQLRQRLDPQNEDVADLGESLNGKWSASDTTTCVPEGKSMLENQSFEEILDALSPEEQASTNAETTKSMQIPSQSVFPERERVPYYVIKQQESPISISQEMPVSDVVPSVSSNDDELPNKSAGKAIMTVKEVGLPAVKPRDFYTVEFTGDLQVFRCLHCSYVRSEMRGSLSKRAAMIRHVQTLHMRKRDRWKCSLCHFHSLKHSRVAKHCRKAHRGKAEVQRERSTNAKVWNNLRLSLGKSSATAR